MAPKKKKKSKAEVKAKAEAKGKGKTRAKAKGQGKDKDKTKAKVEAKGKGKTKAKAKSKDRGKGKRKAKAKVKGKAKTRAKDKGKGKKKAKAEAKVKAKGKAQLAEADHVAIQMVKPKQLAALDLPDTEPTKTQAAPDEAPADRAPPLAARAARQRWERVAARLGLTKHVRAVARWDGLGDPPILTGFSFVRHVESHARDLRCAGTVRAMTQGIMVQREDGKLFLVGRGVAQTYLGLQVPHKDRSNAGRRFLTPLEREALGQPIG